MSSQLDRWTGAFGREYTDRNVVDWRTRVEGFRQMLPADTRSVFEVGTNRGHNQDAIRELGIQVGGCEPNPYALEQAHPWVCGCSVYDLPDQHAARRWDLVFTSGVLIHVPPGRLDEALTNIYRSAARYILAIEYAAFEDTPVEYRGHDDMLWKRNFGEHYRRLFPDLRIIDMGDGVPGFEGATFWLLKK